MMRFGTFHNHSPLEGESQKPSRQAPADAVGGNSIDASPPAILSEAKNLHFSFCHSRH